MADRLYTTTVRLGFSHDEWLTAICAKIRRTSGVHVNKSALLRALIAGTANARLDLSHCADEIGLQRAIAARLRSAATK
jgi:hypothetical protein